MSLTAFVCWLAGIFAAFIGLTHIFYRSERKRALRVGNTGGDGVWIPRQCNGGCTSEDK